MSEHEQAPELDHSPTPTPAEFLDEVADPTPGWSKKYGGRLGIIALCGALQQEIALQSKAVAAVRTAAIHDLLNEMSGKDLAEALSVSKTSISKSTKADAWKDPQW